MDKDIIYPLQPSVDEQQEERHYVSPWSTARHEGREIPPGEPEGTVAGGASAGTQGTVAVQGADASFQGKTFGDVEDFLRGRLDYYKSLEENENERKKRERRERRYKSLATIGDVLGSFHRSFARARGERPMDLPSASKSVRAYIDRARAEREKNADRIMNYAVTLGKLEDGRAQESYRQMRLKQYQQQQDRLDKQEETNRSIAEARVKYYEAQGDKNSEQAAYWKTKADLLERGWPQEQAEQAARIEERKARTAKYNHDAGAPYRSGGKGGSSSSSGTEDDGTMLGRVAVEDPDGLREAVTAATGSPYTKVNNQNKRQVAGAYRAQQRRKKPSSNNTKSTAANNGKKKINW